MATVERRVLRIHPGEKDFWYQTAKANGCPEIQETDKVEPGSFEVFVEQVEQVKATDWADLYQNAPTDAAKLRVIARMLNLL